MSTEEQSFPDDASWPDERPVDRQSEAERPFESSGTSAGGPAMPGQGLAKIARLEAEVAALQAQVEQGARREAKKDAALRWCFEQLRSWWRGEQRDMSRPDLAITEIDRMECALSEQSE